MVGLGQGSAPHQCWCMTLFANAHTICSPHSLVTAKLQCAFHSLRKSRMALIRKFHSPGVLNMRPSRGAVSNLQGRAGAAKWFINKNK